MTDAATIYTYLELLVRFVVVFCFMWLVYGRFDRLENDTRFNHMDNEALRRRLGIIEAVAKSLRGATSTFQQDAHEHTQRLNLHHVRLMQLEGALKKAD